MDNLESALTGFYRAFIGSIILWMFLNGYGDSVTMKDIPGEVDKLQLQYLSAGMQLENESGGDYCLLLTGSVLLNRLNYPDLSNGDGDIAGVIMSNKWGWQYAPKTRNNFKTLKVKKHIKVLAKYLLVYGPICPENVIYQSQNPNLGSEIYDKIKVSGGKYEYFAFE